MDSEGSLFLVDTFSHRVLRWAPGATQGEIVAGGHGAGFGLRQLNQPFGIAVYREVFLIVVDRLNHRVMRLFPGVTQGEIVAGGNGPGGGLHQLSHPSGIAVDGQGSDLPLSSF